MNEHQNVDWSALHTVEEMRQLDEEYFNFYA